MQKQAYAFLADALLHGQYVVNTYAVSLYFLPLCPQNHGRVQSFLPLSPKQY